MREFMGCWDKTEVLGQRMQVKRPGYGVKYRKVGKQEPGG